MKNYYDHKTIEEKWQKKWEDEKSFHAELDTNKEKFYALVEFPFPSGDGLHVGHPRPYIGLDIIARKKRMEGKNVLYPFGWDAFGLPTENYAIKTKQHPRDVTKKNTDRFRKQVKSLGISFDWDREVNTTDPEYYKWTQWIFLQLYKEGLAYKAEMPINWCLTCKIGLANEEVIEGNCERCGGDTEKRKKKQWMLKITHYADKLLGNLETLDYRDDIRTQQENWIGKSEGAQLEFVIAGSNKKILVFTTRADTLYGATYVVLAPEHPLIGELHKQLENLEEVSTYIRGSLKKTEQERSDETKEKTGVELKGVRAINPATNEEISVWVADYVLGEYGTGAIMAVPAHDERDYEFAKKFNLPIKTVIGSKEDEGILFVGEGTLCNSKEFDGISTEEAREKITKHVGGEMVTTYKLRDWVFSRQRYWGEPIPIIHCEECGTVPVPEDQLPVTLPDVEKYEPTDTGESPLAKVEEWVNVACPKCDGEAKRETDVMPNWAGSSWYFLRYTNPHNDKALASKEALSYWMAVDWYNGGMEHTTLHLLYSRFWNLFLHDIGVVPVAEPYKKRTAHGMILAEGGEKMSKSKGNVVNPDDIVERYGADTMRLYEMFMGPFEQAIAWNPQDILGPRKFLERVWDYIKSWDAKKEAEDKNWQAVLHKTIQKVTEDIETMNFNTAVSSLMICSNEMRKTNAQKGEIEAFLILLAPFAPHIAEELWQSIGNKDSVHIRKWPKADERFLEEAEREIGVQINGRVRDSVVVTDASTEKEVKEHVLSSEKVKKWTEGKEIKKFIYVKGKIVNIVV